MTLLPWFYLRVVKKRMNVVHCTKFRTVARGSALTVMLNIETHQGRTDVETDSAAEEADVALAAQAASYKDHPAVRGLGALSEVGDQPPLLALSGAVLAYGMLSGDRRAAGAGARMLGSLVIATWIKTGLKRVVSRTRPNVLLDEGQYEVEAFGPDDGAWHSFPSGHTAGSVAVARSIGRVYPGARAAAYGGAAAVALIQIPRGAHYPVDVVAGALVGIVAEAVVNTAATHLFPERVKAESGREGEVNERAPGAEHDGLQPGQFRSCR